MTNSRDLSTKIGDLCMHWANFDHKIDRLFEIFLKVDATQVACIVASMDNFRARCETLKRLIVNEPPSERWADLLRAVLDFASACMGAKRNRFVHDVWLSSPDSLMRVDKRAVVRKYKAGERDHVAFNLHYPTDIGDIHTLTASVWNMSNLMDWIYHELVQWRKGRPQEPDPQLIQACNTYFELLRHPWPKEARYLLPPQPEPTPEDDMRRQIANSYIVRDE